MFKVWEVGEYQPVQTFNCPLKDIVEINCFTVTNFPKRIVAGGH